MGQGIYQGMKIKCISTGVIYRLEHIYKERIGQSKKPIEVMYFKVLYNNGLATDFRLKRDQLVDFINRGVFIYEK